MPVISQRHKWPHGDNVQEKVMKILENSTVPLDDFILLLEDRTFVDYFNIYQSLPVFGQHVIYNYIEREFSYEPPVKKGRSCIDRKEVVRWLCTHIFPGFSKSCLFLEYILCSKLRDVNINVHSSETDNPDDRYILTKNILGNALGMQLFRDSLKGTAGEKCYRCWFDLEKLQRMPDGEDRSKFMLYIKNVYLTDGAAFELETIGKQVVFEGKLNFELIPESELQEKLIETVQDGFDVYRVNRDAAFRDLQRIILAALRTYWVPRYLLNIMKTVPKNFLAVLKRSAPYDNIALIEERKQRCRFMFPEVYGSTPTKPSMPPTKIIESNVADEMREVSPKSVASSSTESFFVTEGAAEQKDVKLSDLLTICGGGKLQPVGITPASSRKSSSLDFGSDRLRDSRTASESEETQTAPTTHIPTDLEKRPNISPQLSLYISGRKRICFMRKSNSKVMYALAADKLAGHPFKVFLNRQGLVKDETLLEFWTDMRQYLDLDQMHLDEFGNSMKQQLVHKIFDRYLSTQTGSHDAFSENVKSSLFLNLSGQDQNVSLLYFAQDYATGSLKDTWKKFKSNERKIFRRLVCRDKVQYRNISEQNGDCNTPLSCRNVSPADSRSSSSMSNSPSITLSNQHMIKALEFTVNLSEYGRKGVLKYQQSTIADLVDAIYSDYGSLHLNQIPTVRNNFLYHLMFKPKLDIANLKVSRQVFLDKPTVVQDKPRSNRMVLRRHGILIERPPRPKSFVEVLFSQVHYDFFKRFMTGQRMSNPLAFWKSVEDLRDMPTGRLRNNMINNILRKYFSKSAKQCVMLDCTDDIIRQIPTMEKVSVNVLVCAQASVFRAMERKWYPKYLETYPPDPESEKQRNQRSPSPVHIEDIKLEKLTSKRPTKKRKTLHKWQSFVSRIVRFLRSMKDPKEVQLLEIYLKKEIHKYHKQSQQQPVKPSKQKVEKNVTTTASTTMYQNRVVLKNRLIIIDKLPMDLRFWCEVTKYVDQVDYIMKLENISRDNTDFLHAKARNIVNYHLNSEIPPRNQINVPGDLAVNITSLLDKEGPTRGLFHDAFILLFPVLYHYWRQCQKEWLWSHDAGELLTLLEEGHRQATPHKFAEVPDYLKIRSSQIKITTQPVLPNDENFIINFSLLEGCKLILAQPRIMKPEERRVSVMTKQSMTRRQSVMGKRASLVVKTSNKTLLNLLAEESGKSSSSSNVQKSPQDKENDMDHNFAKLKPQGRAKGLGNVVTEVVKDDVDQDLFTYE